MIPKVWCPGFHALYINSKHLDASEMHVQNLFLSLLERSYEVFLAPAICYCSRHGCAHMCVVSIQLRAEIAIFCRKHFVKE